MSSDIELRVELAVGPEQSERIERIVRECLCFAPWWLKKMIVRTLVEDNGGAVCIVRRQYRDMTIFVSRSLHSDDDKIIKEFILHEIAHASTASIAQCINEDLNLFIKDADIGKIFEKIVERRIEECTEDLSIIFEKLAKVHLGE